MDVPILGQPPEEKLMPTDGPKVRLLFCFKCKTLEELPDFEGDPAYDYLLQIMVDKHETTGIPHAGQLMRVPIKLWEVSDIRDAIVKQIYDKGAPGLDAISPGFYDTKSTFAEDAMTCYKQHNRPKESCADYGSEKKLLMPDTKAERKDLGLSPVREGGPKNYLCQFCPMHSVMVSKKREKSGLFQ